jgi:hypothetical protein
MTCRRGVRSLLLLAALLPARAIAQDKPAPAPSSAQDEVILAAVSREDSMLSGGIGGSIHSKRGSIHVEPLARLTAAGVWKRLPCETDLFGKRSAACANFLRDYLGKPHNYTVVSAEGQGVTVHALPNALDECGAFAAGNGTYTGGTIAHSAIAAPSTQLFNGGEALRELTAADKGLVRNVLATLASKKLDSTGHLRYFSLTLEGQPLIVVQRSFEDSDPQPESAGLKMIFAIGRMESGRFHILFWKKNIEDDDERIVGAICLKSGREFLITSVSSPEAQEFRVYGIKDGKLTLVYRGGGGSC